ncbi:MAG: hypothetical protein GY923_15880 [Aestuariibacter sp.]|nr:hypothetical protein [Aestuariibacter sp.]
MAFFRLGVFSEKSKSKTEIKAVFRSSTFGFAAEKVKLKMKLAYIPEFNVGFATKKVEIKIENRSNTSIHHWFFSFKSKNEKSKKAVFLQFGARRAQKRACFRLLTKKCPF